MDGMIEVCFLLLRGRVFMEKVGRSQPHNEGNEEAICYRSATDCGNHHGLTMVWLGSSFFFSSSLTGMAT